MWKRCKIMLKCFAEQQTATPMQFTKQKVTQHLQQDSCDLRKYVEEKELVQAVTCWGSNTWASDPQNLKKLMEKAGSGPDLDLDSIIWTFMQQNVEEQLVLCTITIHYIPHVSVVDYCNCSVSFIDQTFWRIEECRFLKWPVQIGRLH